MSALAGVDREGNRRLNTQERTEGAVRLRSKPSRAWLSVTGACNLLCTHCPRSLVDEAHLSAAEMQPAVLDRVTREVFPSVEMLRIGGNNLGEQLFAKSWNRFASIVRSQEFTPWLITNGQTLNRARIADLVEAGYIVDISIDAAGDDGYRQIRGASLANLREHVRAIISERALRDAEDRGSRRRARVIFSFTAFADNVDELPALVRLAAELGVDEVVVTHYMPSFEGQRFQSLFYHRRTANQVFADARAIADACGVTLQLPPPYPVPSLADEPSLRVKVKDRYGRDLEPRRPPGSQARCHHPWTSVSINEKGEVYPCCQSNLLMGNLSTSTFDAIWNNGRYRKLRRTVNTDRAPSDCQRCVLRGETFTSVECSDGGFFLRNLDLRTWHNDSRHARAREWLARTRLGRWIWGWGRRAYKNFFEWHFA